ncbi:hypothetical protein BCR35DRAFT_350828 [Leucosporidium creatinivorum]|uniref:F-box domain-containing protein n=1 Tax=Leucosporidium creatinivorum TaxID=106004 RepID=A0A1Y2FYF2_9BASI|nr:hypothetical protein BCR35DRAFT_350828 [Leucosporidium creatinivorum]
MQPDSAALPVAEEASELDTTNLPPPPVPLLAVERDQAPADSELEASDEAPEDVDEEFIPKSRRKAPAKKRKLEGAEATAALKKRKGARLGRLEAMLQSLPMEILGEILSHLNPPMLIRLSRMAKVFRSLLMTKTSRVIWRRAFDNDGIGELEAPDWSEPKLASLIWDKECELCGRQKVHKICYALRKRVCDACFKTNLSTPGQILAEHPELHPDTFKCCPFTDTPPCRGGNWPGAFGHNSGLQLFLTPVVLAESANLTDLAQRDRLNELLGDETQESQVQAHVKHCEELLPKVAKDAKMLQEWQFDHDGSRSTNKRLLRQERAATIQKHCEGAGYEAIDIQVGLSHSSPVYSLVDQPYALTDRVWRKISVTIFAHLTKVHQDRLDAEARRLVEEQRRREMEEVQRQQHARRLNEVMERMRARLTSSGYGAGHGQQQQQGGPQGAAGPSYGGAGAGGGYGYGGGAGRDYAGRPVSPEERALYLVQQILQRTPTTGFTLADLQLLEGAMAMLPDPAGRGPPGDDGAGGGGWF